MYIFAEYTEHNSYSWDNSTGLLILILMRHNFQAGRTDKQQGSRISQTTTLRKNKNKNLKINILNSFKIEVSAHTLMIFWNLILNYNEHRCNNSLPDKFFSSRMLFNIIQSHLTRRMDTFQPWHWNRLRITKRVRNSAFSWKRKKKREEREKSEGFSPIWEERGK